MNRKEVYEVIDGERDYQEKKWPGNKHTPTEYLVYMRDYVEEALHTISRTAQAEADVFALNNIRKITAMGVACMEQNVGIPR